MVIRNSKQLNEVFQECVVPKFKRIHGKAKSVIDTGLDSHLHNYHIAEKRQKEREWELAQRMKNPLTYPSKGETLRDQERAVPTQNTLAKLGLLDNKKRFMGKIELENMIMDNISKYGLLVTQQNSTENPALFREAVRPSLITQHINFQSRKLWLQEKA